MTKRLGRSIPFFKVLVNSPKHQRAEILKRFPNFVMEDFVEVLVNIVKGNVNAKRFRVTLDKQKTPLLNLMQVYRNKQNRRAFIYKQKGGFVSALIPIIASVAAGFANVL